MPRTIPLCVCAAGAAALVGCGGGGNGHATASTRAAAPAPTTQSAPPTSPQSTTPAPRASGKVAAGDERVIRTWATRLRRGDVRGAARLFAPGSRAQNGTPVIVLATRALRIAFNDGLSCGAVPTGFAAGPRGFVLVEFRLVSRPGGSCAGAVGAPARSAIRVRRGLITDWIRLPTPSTPAGSSGGGDVA